MQKRDAVSKLIRIIATEFAALAAITLVVASISGAKALSVNEQAHELDRNKPLLVTNSTGCSMLPAFSEDELIVVSTNRLPGVGDVIVFETDGKLINHRVTRFDKATGEIDTKGDNNEHADDYDTTLENTIGVVVAHVPYIGHIANMNPYLSAAMSGTCMLECVLMLEIDRIRSGRARQATRAAAARRQLGAYAQQAMLRTNP